MWCSLLCSQLKIVCKDTAQMVDLAGEQDTELVPPMTAWPDQVGVSFPDQEQGEGRRPWMGRAVGCPGSHSKHPLRTFTSEVPFLQREEVKSHPDGVLSQAGRYVL